MKRMILDATTGAITEIEDGCAEVESCEREPTPDERMDQVEMALIELASIMMGGA